MNVDRQMKPAAFANEIAEDVSLKGAIFLLGRHTPGGISLVDLFSLLSGRIAKLGRTKVGDLELHRDPTLVFLIVFKYLRDELQIVVERSRKLSNFFLLHPAMQHLFLQRDVDLLVNIAGTFFLVVERPT